MYCINYKFHRGRITKPSGICREKSQNDTDLDVGLGAMIGGPVGAAQVFRGCSAVAQRLAPLSKDKRHSGMGVETEKPMNLG